MSSLIDFDEIDKLGDPEFVFELIGLFRETCAEELKTLRAALVAGDLTALKRGAHKLRGTCLALHAREMNAFAAELESVVSPSNLGEVDRLLARLDDAFVQANALLSTKYG